MSEDSTFEDSTINPEDINLEDSKETILKSARNAETYGPSSGGLLQPNVLAFATAVASVFGNSFKQFEILAASNQQITQSLQDAGLGDLTNHVDPGFGFNNSSGNSEIATHNMLAYGTSAETPSDDLFYNQLDSVLTGSLSQDWKTKNSSPGNPLIIEAYALSGRNYDKDGFSNEYNWNTAFANWVLSKCGLSFTRSMSPLSYNGYGNPVDFGTFKNVRKNDIIIFKSGSNIGTIGFVRSFNKTTNRIKILGGNLAGTVKEIEIPFSRTDPTIRVTHVRRNWTIPPEVDTPLFGSTKPEETSEELKARSLLARLDALEGRGGKQGPLGRPDLAATSGGGAQRR